MTHHDGHDAHDEHQVGALVRVEEAPLMGYISGGGGEAEGRVGLG